MYCPETIFVSHRLLFVYHYGVGDTDWNRRPLRERLNPLRWTVVIGPRPKRCLRINKDAKLNLALSNFIYKYLGGKRRLDRKFNKERGLNGKR